MNTERLRILADHIERLANSDDSTLGFNMSQWLAHNDYDYRGHNCGTVACIAGHAVLLFVPNDAKHGNYLMVQLALDALGAITEAERVEVAQLFYDVYQLRTPEAAAAALRKLAALYEQKDETP